MSETLRLRAADVRRLAENVFVACGAPSDEAVLIAEHLVKANLMGYDSHGIIRIPQYVNDVKRGVVVPGAAAVRRCYYPRDSGSRLCANHNCGIRKQDIAENAQRRTAPTSGYRWTI